MKIRILIAGTFSKFIRVNKVSTQQLAVGDIVDYPDWYAGCMVKMKRAEVHSLRESTVGTAVALSTVWKEMGTQTIKTVDATDAAFRLAGELDVDLLALAGSGKGGRITAGDVRTAAQ